MASVFLISFYFEEGKKRVQRKHRVANASFYVFEVPFNQNVYEILICYMSGQSKSFPTAANVTREPFFTSS